MQGIIRINAVDVAEIRADSKHDPHRIRFSPVAVKDHDFDYEALIARANQLLDSASRALDTSAWLG
eukprot:9572232-Karenia_brevis.AAC.1